MAASGFNITSVSQAFKIMFAQGLIQPMSMKDSPFRGRLEMSDSWGAQQVYSVPMRYSLPAARSRTAQTAINERINSAVNLAQWVMKPGFDYGTFRIQYSDILRARTDEMAFARLQQLAVTSSVEGINASINRALYRDGTGSLAIISATASTTPAGTSLSIANSAAVLTNAADAYLFEVGNYYQFFNSVNANNQPITLNGGQAATVTAIDTEAGYVYFNTNLTTFVGLTAGTLVVQTDDGVGYGSNLEGGSIVGVAAYFPLISPQPADNLWGQNRSFFPTKLAGHRKDARGLNLWEEVMRMSARIRRFNGKPNALYCAPEQLQNMLVGREGFTENFRDIHKVGGDDGRGGRLEAEVGYDGIRIQTPVGPIEAFGDPFCPPDRVYLMQDDTLHLHTMGDFPHLVDMGNKDGLLQEQDDYALQGRLFASGQFYCDAPAYGGVLQVTPVF